MTEDGYIDPDDGEYGLLMPFDTDDPMFRKGFEVGRLWAIAETLKAAQGPHTVHADIAEMILRIAESNGLRATCEILDDQADWLSVALTSLHVPGEEPPA